MGGRTVGNIIQELENRIAACELQKKRLIHYKQANNKKLNSRLKGKTILEWFSIYNSCERSCKAKLKQEKENQRKVKNKVAFAAVSVILASLLIVSGIYTNPSIAGFATAGGQQEFAQALNLSFSESVEFRWQPEHAGTLNSAKLSGSVEGSGYAKVYLNDLLVLYINLSQKTPSEAEQMLTGFASLNSQNSDSEKAAPSAAPANQELPFSVDFTDTCEETCSISLNKASYIIRVELSDAKLNLSHIAYTVTPEVQAPEENLTVPENATEAPAENITAEPEMQAAFGRVPKDFPFGKVTQIIGKSADSVAVKTELDSGSELWVFNLEKNIVKLLGHGASAPVRTVAVKGSHIFWIGANGNLFVYDTSSQTISEKPIPEYEVSEGKRAQVIFENILWKIIVYDKIYFYSDAAGEVTSDDEPSVKDAFREKYPLDESLETQALVNLGLPAPDESSAAVSAFENTGGRESA